MLALFILFASLPAATPREIPATNLLRNGSFAKDVSGWKASADDPNPESGSMAWSRSDAEGSKTSGSLALVTSATGDRNTFRVGQCLPLFTQAVARYHALEAGFWHEPVLSNTVKVKIVRKEPCAK